MSARDKAPCLAGLAVVQTVFSSQQTAFILYANKTLYAACFQAKQATLESYTLHYIKCFVLL